MVVTSPPVRGRRSGGCESNPVASESSGGAGTRRLQSPCAWAGGNPTAGALVALLHLGERLDDGGGRLDELQQHALAGQRQRLQAGGGGGGSSVE